MNNHINNNLHYHNEIYYNENNRRNSVIIHNEVDSDEYSSCSVIEHSDIDQNQTENNAKAEEVTKTHTLAKDTYLRKIASPSEAKKTKRLVIDARIIDISKISIILFKNLVFLDLSKNMLRKLDDGICTLKKLKELYLHDNLLEELPENIGKLKKLIILHLHNNYFKILPESIGKLKNVEDLTISDNPNLKKLPASMGKMKKIPLPWNTQGTRIKEEDKAAIFKVRDKK